MKRASTRDSTGEARIGRPGIFSGPAKAVTAKRGRNNLCENCGHVRAEHPRSQQCKYEGCSCEEMAFSVPATRHAYSRFSEEETAKAKEMLDRGFTYTEVSRLLKRANCTLRNHLPGYGENSPPAGGW